MTDPYAAAPLAARDYRPTFAKGVTFLLVLAGLIAVMLAGALALRSDTGPKVAESEPDPLTVEVAEIEITRTFELAETFSGLARPRRTSQLGVTTGGRIESVRVRVGDAVRAGETLVKLDTRALAAQLASLEAAVAEAKAAHRLALDTVERQRTLLVNGHISAQRLDEAEAQATTAAARTDAARAQADALRVQIELARIAAPYDGVITSRFADEGAIAGPGQPILELVEESFLEAQIGVPSDVVSSLMPGESYELLTDSGAIKAKLRGVTGVVNASQRTVAAVFEFEAARDVPAGSLVRLSVPRTIEEGGFWVPLKSLTSASRGLWTVYVAAPAGAGARAEARLVEMVHTSGDRAFVRGPMQTGDRVITDGLHRITPGVPVRPQLTERAPASSGG